ncbi:MAG: hypothetical protein AUJ52_06265 [Elusimicrobia bacterium CG1_02_63_36]|nr:MAG: hypothetical protein AUJ52_06265 [Elusimicrobia bacterium CG1_02_63_36]PIP82877.1 MAG: hypothetical protein COR54_12545 [Elusimicrobia bacterium CG22_combo_CG10-13_8_21_14_all_63_91]PJA16605.1 MAG: hypothetical protein COX66_07125 [Elusimicrobia bacterium CG_4_10_14_0_2_um_filter_63_34]PJB25972.1 MAG: hypothetical protein CO113_05945 [Elusimicrobia bacterium CG_4_9_14_3_um_filter_62_55]
MAEGLKLRKLCPPFGTPESPIWEFGYDEQVRVVGGLCIVKSPAMRDRLVKMGYELATEDEAPPAGGEAEENDASPATDEVSPAPANPNPVDGSSDPAAAPEEQPPGSPSGGA